MSDMRSMTVSQNTGRNVFVLIVLTGVLRVYGAMILGLGVDESYAVAVSRIPTLSFVDHPPLGFMLARWAADLFGSEARLILRAPYLLMFAGSTWLVYRLTSYLFGGRAGFWAAAWFSIAPFFALSAGSWIVPDGPLIFFLLLTALLIAPLFMEEVLDRIWLRWLLAGGALGLAFLSKYHAVLFAFGVFIFMLTTPKGRRWLSHPAPYVAGLVALLLFSPVLIWNAQHEWQSLAFQSGRAGPGEHFTLIKGVLNFARLQLGQLIYLLPGPFLAALWLLWRSLGQGPKDLPRWFCLWLALPAILVINILAPISIRTLPHWSMPGFLFAFPLLGDWINRTFPPGNRVLRINFALGAGFLIALMALGSAHIRSGALTSPFYQTPPRWDDTSLLMEWDELGAVLQKEGWLDRKNVHLVAKNWIIAARIDRAVRGKLPVFVLAKNKHHFAHLYDPKTLQHQTGLLIHLARPGEEGAGLQSLIRAARGSYQALTPLKSPIDLMRGDQLHRRFVLMTGTRR